MSPSGRNQSEHSPLGVRLGGEAASVGRRFWNKYWGLSHNPRPTDDVRPMPSDCAGHRLLSCPLGAVPHYTRYPRDARPPAKNRAKALFLLSAPLSLGFTTVQPPRGFVLASIASLDVILGASFWYPSPRWRPLGGEYRRQPIAEGRHV
jgi:hypothetical protein